MKTFARGTTLALAIAVFAMACGDSATGPERALLPDGATRAITMNLIDFPNGGTYPEGVADGVVRLCKTANVAGTFNFTVTTAGGGVLVAAPQFVIGAGGGTSCQTVYTSNLTGNETPDQVVITEAAPPANWALTNIDVVQHLGLGIFNSGGYTGFLGDTESEAGRVANVFVNGDMARTVTFTNTFTPSAAGAVLLVIDEDGIDNGLHFNKSGGPIVPSGPNFFSPNGVNENNSSEKQRGVLPFFANNVGLTITVKTGKSDDEGWFAPNCIPAKFLPAFSKEDNTCLTNGNRDLAIDNFFGLNGTGAIPPQERLDKIPHLIPLRALGLNALIGKTVCAVVYDSDVSINYDHDKPEMGVNGKLQGETYGIVAFDVIAVNTLNGFSSSTLPQVTITIRDPALVCGTWVLFRAPVPKSSSVPNDRVAPGSIVGYKFPNQPPVFF
jgi:hypothetical protein